jgi:hypothetical protein
LRDSAFRQDIGEWKVAVLQELSSQKNRLLPKPSVAKKRHREASSPAMGV